MCMLCWDWKKHRMFYTIQRGLLRALTLHNKNEAQALTAVNVIEFGRKFGKYMIIIISYNLEGCFYSTIKRSRGSVESWTHVFCHYLGNGYRRL